MGLVPYPSTMVLVVYSVPPYYTCTSREFVQLERWSSVVQFVRLMVGNGEMVQMVQMGCKSLHEFSSL